MNMRPDPPPEGKLIADAADNLSLSIREAARRAGISYGRWRQIVTGYQNVSPGEYAAVRAPARTVARMAKVVGVTPSQLEEAGRADAADILRAILKDEQGATLTAVPELPEDDARIIELAQNATVLALDREVPRVEARIRSAGPNASGAEIFPESSLSAFIFDQYAVPLDERVRNIALILMNSGERRWRPERSG
jgi:hypothetical protein